MTIRDKAAIISIGSWGIVFSVMAMMPCPGTDALMRWALAGCCWFAFIIGFQHGYGVGTLSEPETETEEGAKL